MPTLNWIGKDKVINHHNEVPYRMLERKYSYGNGKMTREDNGSQNMIIHGDNLEALKALLPKYEGKIKCIYIDPPYNTGNEGWVYNDNVNDPKIKKWLGEVVGKEGEDLSRHDKWLCMMYPRLRLLQKLLSDDGAIFISIDDNEIYNLKLICDEVFGLNCFVSNVSWQRTYAARNDSKGISNAVEHILVYSKCPNWNPNRLPRTKEMNAKYANPDNDVSDWRTDNAFAPGAITHQGMVYAIQHPFTGELIYPGNARCWTFGQEQALEIMNGWCRYKLADLHDEAKRAEVCGISVKDIRKDVKGIVLVDTLENSRTKAQAVYERGKWPKYYFTKGGMGGIAKKTYLNQVGGRTVTNFWSYEETGHTDEAKKEMISIFAGKTTFDTPKPSRLIEFVLKCVTNQDSIILDSFAGSGTTAHAVLNMNKADGGNRKFILIEMMDYAESITAERVRRVIDGYGEESKKVEGTGGDFSFYELGERLLLEYGDLNPNADVEKIRDYIWYMETKTGYANSALEDNVYYLSTYNDVAYYFYYEKEIVTILDRDFLTTVKTKADGYVIYADMCTLSDELLRKYNITFKKIPRDIAKL